MKDKIFFSIITPTYNRLDSGYLEECIASLKNQKKGSFDYEHIIVDDGSSDGTKKFIESLSKNNKKIKYIYQSNSGPAKAIQNGIKHANGDFVIIMDDDDMLTQDSLFLRSEYIKENPDVDWFYGLSEWVDDYSLPIESPFQSKFPDNFFYERLLVSNFINGGTPTVKSKCLKKIVWPSWLNRSQDYFIWLEMARPEKKLKVGFIEKYLYVCRSHLQAYTKNIDTDEKRNNKFEINRKIQELHPSSLAFLANEAFINYQEAYKNNLYWRSQFDAQINPLKAKVAYLEEVINSHHISRIIGPVIKVRDNRRRYQHYIKTFPRRAYGKALRTVSASEDKLQYVTVKKTLKEKDTPFVSIVTPFYNRHETMPETIRSVLGQTFQDFEYIIVDDGSTNADSIKYIKKIKHSKIKVIYQKNAGVAEARNNGINISKGKYVLCLDSDDIIDPTYIEKALVVLETDPEVSIVTFDTKMFGVMQQNYHYKGFEPMAMIEDNLIITAAVFKREAWKVAGGYKKEIGYEDWEFWVNIVEKGFLAKHIPEPIFHYRTAENSRFIDDQEEHSTNTTYIKQTHPNYRLNIKRLIESSKGKKFLYDPAEAFVNLSSKNIYKQTNNNNPNILIAIPWMTFGGAETLINNFCKEIYQEFNISFVTGIKSPNEWEYKFREISPNIYHLANMFDDPRLYIEFISNYIKTRNIKILHIIHTSYVFDMLQTIKREFPNLKIIVTVFNDRAHFNESVEASKFVDVYTTDNHAVARKYKNLLTEKSTPNPVRVIPNGINNSEVFNLNKYDVKSERKKLGIKNEEISVFFIGRLSEEKKPDVFTEVADSIIHGNHRKSFKFFMIGDGPMKPKLQKKLSEINSPRLKYLGYQSDVARYLCTADVFVLPSSIEGFPLSILEAMAMETVVVASDVGAVADVIENGVDGYVVSPSSADEITEALYELERNRTKLEQMKKLSAKKVDQKYSNKILGKNYRDLYNGK